MRRKEWRTQEKRSVERKRIRERRRRRKERRRRKDKGRSSRRRISVQHLIYLVSVIPRELFY